MNFLKPFCYSKIYKKNPQAEEEIVYHFALTCFHACTPQTFFFLLQKNELNVGKYFLAVVEK